MDPNMTLWCRVSYQPLAYEVAERCKRERPDANVEVRLGEDGWEVWVEETSPFVVRLP